MREIQDTPVWDSKATGPIYQCPRSLLEQHNAALNELFRCWQHWDHGALAVRDCGPGLADAIAICDIEIGSWRQERDERALAEQERKWQSKQQ